MQDFSACVNHSEGRFSRHTCFGNSPNRRHRPMKSVLYCYRGYDGDVIHLRSSPSVIAIADESKLRRRNHNELAVLTQALNVTPIICGHLVVSSLCPSSEVLSSDGLPDGTSEGNQYLGSSSRSVGDILRFSSVRAVDLFYIMTLSLPSRQPAGSDGRLCPSGKRQAGSVKTCRRTQYSHVRHTQTV